VHIAFDTEPSGAEVTVFRVRDKTGFPDRNPRTGALEEEKILRSIGAGGRFTTPVSDLRIPLGNYLFVINKDGYAAVRYPILLESGFDKNRQAKVTLYRDGYLPENHVYVPAGWFKFGEPAEWRNEGGFFISKYEVTWAEYMEWYETLPLQEQSERTPYLLKRMENAPYELEPAEPLLPIMKTAPSWRRRPAVGMSADDIDAYISWKNRTAGDGFTYGLPPETAWEKAARGVDGRRYPWGDEFSGEKVNYRGHYSTFEKHEFPTRLEFPGSRPEGVSIYGVYQMAGNLREWTWRVGEGRRRIIRGASMYSEEFITPCAFRPPVDVFPIDDHGGFRLYVPINK